MPTESDKRKAELKREITTLWVDNDGQKLEGLTIEQLQKIKSLQEKVNEYLDSLKN
jgi:hypothetical protein